LIDPLLQVDTQFGVQSLLPVMVICNMKLPLEGVQVGSKIIDRLSVSLPSPFIPVCGTEDTIILIDD